MSVKALLPLALALASCAPSTAPCPGRYSRPERQGIGGGVCRPRGLVRPRPTRAHLWQHLLCRHLRISVILITSDKGHILIDTAPAKAAPSVLANIRTLGFDPKDVKFLLTSHEHIDHVGGIAAIKAATGATLIARAEAISGLETGKVGREDPQYDIIVPFDGAKVDRVIKDGEVLRLGPIAITAIATPGHTMGGTSWRWKSCEGKKCQSIVFADSISAVSADDYRFSDHPALIAVFRSTLTGSRHLDAISADAASGRKWCVRAAVRRGTSRLPGQCAAYAKTGHERLDARLAKEKTAKS